MTGVREAEDGIRDGHVTGVQTCALPISTFPKTLRTLSVVSRRHCGIVPLTQGTPKRTLAEGCVLCGNSIRRWPSFIEGWLSRRSRNFGQRSEERRVGKEYR